MKKILITSLIVLTCMAAFISCNADTSIGTAIYESVKTVDVKQQKLIHIKSDNSCAYLITENGIDKYTITNYKVTKTENIFENKSTAQVHDAYWVGDDSGYIYYLTNGYDDDASESTTELWKYDPSDSSKTKITAAFTDFSAETHTYISNPVLFSSKLNLYSKAILDSPFLADKTADSTNYTTCRKSLESEGALLLSNEKHWYISTDGKCTYSETGTYEESAFTNLVKITGYINSDRISENPIAFKKIETGTDTYNYWIICPYKAYVITMYEKTGEDSKVTAHTEVTSPFSSTTRLVTFENDDYVFLKLSADYSSVYAYNNKKGRTDLSSFTKTYSLSKTLNIVDVEPISVGDGSSHWFAATLDSGLYHIKFDGSSFTATSMQQ